MGPFLPSQVLLVGWADARLTRIYTDVTGDLAARNQALLRDPSTSVSLQAPMYMISLERDAWLDSIDTQYEYK